MEGTESGDLRRRIATHEWYHTLELAPGVLTPGWYDTRELADRLPWPRSLAGRRCLDVGTFDGFWAFELERRGAAEVVAIDLLEPDQWDWPEGRDDATVEALRRRRAAGDGFELARAALGSAVVRRERSVYALEPARDGEFDFVYLGSLLLHLRDPIGALAAVRRVCRGELLVVDAIDLGLDLLHRRRPALALDGVGRPWWFVPNRAALARMVEAAGFRVVEGPRRVTVPYGPGQPARRPRPRELLSRRALEALLAARGRDPHAALVARPA